MFFDGSNCNLSCGIGIHIVSPRRVVYEFAFRLASKLTNNQTEYEAICKGLELLLDAGADVIQVFGDLKVVIRQLTEDYDCASDNLHPYFVRCHDLMARFRQVTLTWLPREQNVNANKLAQVTSGYLPQTDDVSVEISQLSTADWRVDLLQYLKDPTRGADMKTRRRALKHDLIGDEMYFRTIDGVLFKCLGPSEILDVMHDVHEGTCGTHQSAHKMKWLIRRSGFYWPTMLEDCFRYYSGC